MADPTLEQLYQKLDSFGKIASDMETFLAAKKAEDEKKPDEEKEKMEAKKAKYDAAIKTAMEEKDHEEKMAQIKKATEDFDKDDTKKEAFGKPDDKKHEATDEEKEKDAQVAAIIEDKKQDFINKILTANSIMNPTGLKEVEARLKIASITEVQKEWNILAPAFEGAVTTNIQKPQEKFIGYYANVNPTDIDSNQLTASSPDSDFSKLTTKELLEGKL